MESELNKKLVTNVLKYIPKNKKAVMYLVNALNISRESAYRRIRGDIPFTVEELVSLAINLEFSIDQIYDQEKQNHAFFDFSRIEKSSFDFFLFMLKKYNELLEKTSYAKKMEAIMAFNIIPSPFFAGFNHLFKFSYYQWLHQDKESCRNTPYSEIALPEEAVFIQKKLKANLFKGSGIILIYDMNIFLNLIKEIQYFHHRKLLTNDELLLLKEDTLRLIEQYEDIVQTGSYGQTKVQVYLSPLCINSNTVYYNYDDTVDSLFWVFTINPVIIRNSGIISMQLKWLNSLKRQSALISQSNEIKQAEFFYQQREFVNKYLCEDNIF